MEKFLLKICWWSERQEFFSILSSPEAFKATKSRQLLPGGKKVSPEIIREFYGVIVAEGTYSGLVVTVGTLDAKDFAKGKSIDLINDQKREKPAA